MKLSVLTTLAVATLSTDNCNAFSTNYNPTTRNSVVALNANANSDNNDNDNGNTESGFMTRRAAAAAMFLSASAGLAQAATAADTSLDFALPSYDPKMKGFGEGSEAYFKKGTIVKNGDVESQQMIDPGADEKEKQLAAMRKAEEQRKVALAKKKADQKERDEESARRAKEKKARDKERLKDIWNS